MSANYKKLGDYIQPVDVRNSDLKVSHLLGLSIEKCFIESIANTIGTDFRPYKIVKKGQFAYGPVTSRNGDKITIALLKEADVCIISSSYSVFEITDTTKLLPEYLMLWFSRPEFDRYARYKSHGSVREIFDWDEMCRVELPVPDLKEQEKIVKTYNAITKRIQLKQKINENLEKTAQLIFKETFSNDSNDKKIPLYDFAEYINGTSFEEDEYTDEGFPIIKIAELKNRITVDTQYCLGIKDKKFLIKDDDIVFSWSGNPETSIDVFVWTHGNAILNQHIFKINTDKKWFMYNLLKFFKPQFIRLASGKQTTGLGHITVADLKKLEFFYKESLISFYDNKISSCMQLYTKNLHEINTLQELKQLVISKISRN